jgi:CheY-like chemotaxis protein/HPt (histidine-containing phosphotransfer) domain-containing protein
MHLPDARILVVDDGEANRQFIELVLSRAGATVTTGVNGQEAIDMATSRSFDAILLDMQMPVLDGYAAATRLRQQGLKIPIIALTANAMTGDEAKCRAAGCSGFLAKPVDIDDLLSCLTEALGDPVPGLGTLGQTSATAESASSSLPGPPGPRPPLTPTLPMDDPEARQIVRQFVVELEVQLEAMRRAWADRDFETLASLAHSLHGAGGTLGFDEFTGPATVLEQLAKDQREDGVETALAELARLADRVVPPGAGHSGPDDATPASRSPDWQTARVVQSLEQPAHTASPGIDGPADRAVTTEVRQAARRPPLVSSLPTSDPDFRAIVEGFVVRLKEQVTAMRSAWQAGDFQELAGLAHWLKGAGGTVGFAPLSDIAKELERVAKQNERDGIDKVLAELVEMVDSIQIPPADPAVHPAVHPAIH